MPNFSSLTHFRAVIALCISACGLLFNHSVWSQDKSVRIGVPTSVQLQVGRDTLTAVKMAVDEINKKGGVLGRKFEFVSADETENPETGISAIKKLTADENVDLLIGGYTAAYLCGQNHLFGRGCSVTFHHQQSQARLRQLQIHIPGGTGECCASGPRTG